MTSPNAQWEVDCELLAQTFLPYDEFLRDELRDAITAFAEQLSGQALSGKCVRLVLTLEDFKPA